MVTPKLKNSIQKSNPDMLIYFKVELNFTLNKGAGSNLSERLLVFHQTLLIYKHRVWLKLF